MKKILSLILLVFLSASFLSLSAAAEDTRTLYIYNWGEYISDGSEDSLDVNSAFEEYCAEELGIDVEVNYSTYSSNEDMYAKITSGTVAYDVIIPSDYMVARMAAEGLLAEINPEENIENYKYIDDEFKNLYYDPDNIYSVPYTLGTVGIIYNTEMVDEEDTGSWDLMWNPKYTGNILQFNNPRDGIATAQFKLGYDVNSDNEAEWREALDALKSQKAVLQGYVMDEIFNKMKGGSAAVSAYYAGDYFTMYGDNESLAFYYPEEGTNVFVDAMCVPYNSENKDLAIEYINFMESEEIATANAEYICYASPNVLVKENEEYIEYMQEEIHPDAMEILYDFDISKMDFYYDLSDSTRILMNELWEDLKIESSIDTSVFVICGIIIASLLFLLIRGITVKRKREACFRKYAK